MAIVPPPLPGDTVGSFLLDSTVGVGGNATVYLAFSPGYGRVALKILHPGKTTTDEVQRFRREYLALQDLDHPGIVKVFEAGSHGDYPWIAMEYVPGMDLGSVLEQWEAKSPEDHFERVEAIAMHQISW